MKRRLLLAAAAGACLLGLARPAAAAWTIGPIQFVESSDPSPTYAYGTGGQYAEELGTDGMRSYATAWLTVGTDANNNTILITGQAKNTSDWKRLYTYDGQGGPLPASQTIRLYLNVYASVVDANSGASSSSTASGNTTCSFGSIGSQLVHAEKPGEASPETASFYRESYYPVTLQTSQYLRATTYAQVSCTGALGNADPPSGSASATSEAEWSSNTE